MKSKICPEGLLEWPEDLHAVVNPDPQNANIFFDYMDAVNHCTTACTKKDECTSENKVRILNIFNQANKIAS